jgi:hypothetical protein
MLLSVLAFFGSLTIPRLRPHSLRALIAPLAFGFCSIFGMAVIVLFSEAARTAPLNGPRGTVIGFSMWFVPGLLGTWLALAILKRIEQRWLKTRRARGFVVRLITSLIVFGLVFMVSVGVSVKFFQEWVWAHEYLSFCLAFMAAGSTAVLTYLLLGALQERVQGQG